MQFFPSRSNIKYLSQGRYCRAMRLIQLLVFVLWVHFRSRRVFEVFTLGVARSPFNTDQTGFWSLASLPLHPQLRQVFGGPSKRRERQVGMRMCAHLHFVDTSFLLSLPPSPPLNDEKNWNLNSKRSEMHKRGSFVEKPILAADGGNFFLARSPGLLFFLWILILAVTYAPYFILSPNDGEFKWRKMQVSIWRTRKSVWMQRKSTF